MTFEPPELTRMRTEDPVAFDALMKQRGAEFDQHLRGPLETAFEKKFGPDGNVFQQVNPTGWKNDLLYRTTGAAGGNTLAQDIVGGNVGAGSSPAALGFLKKVGSKLKEIWDRPIIAPTITKEEHDQLIQGGGGGVHNWQNH